MIGHHALALVMTGGDDDDDDDGEGYDNAHSKGHVGEEGDDGHLLMMMIRSMIMVMVVMVILPAS